MLGIDSTTISRFENKDEKFVKRILHENEYDEYKSVKNKPYFLASRFSIKEAIYKIDNSFVEFSKIYISKKQNGAYHFEGFCISTTSEGDTYTSIVMKGYCNEIKI